MKGLFVKDWILVFKNKMYLLILILVGLLNMLNDAAFGCGFIVMLSGMLAISTITRDEIDHGFTFLFTLPFNLKEYLIEKYIFALALSMGSGVIGLLFGLAVGSLTIERIGPLFVYLWITIVLLLSILIPFQIKFGAERSRIVLGIVIGVILGLIIGFDGMPIPTIRLSQTAFILFLGIGSLLFMGASMMISYSILKEKEF